MERGIARAERINEEQPDGTWLDLIVVMVDGDREDEIEVESSEDEGPYIEALGKRFWTVQGRYEDGWIVERRP